MSICLVCGVGFCALPIAMQASLSSCITVAASCGIPRSQRMLRTYRIIFSVSYAAMNSTSVEDPAIVGWNLHLYAIVPPAKRKQAPPKERRVLGQVAQSESAYACSMLASYSGRASVSSKSCLLLWTVERTLFELRSWCRLPKVYPIILCDVKIFECMLQAVIMVFVWTVV